MLPNQFNRYVRIFVLILLIFPAVSCANDATQDRLEARSYPTQGTEHWSLKSNGMGEMFDISVALPIGYAANAEMSFPALFVVDGNRLFGSAVTQSRFLAGGGAAGGGAIEDMFIIAIGTPFEEGEVAYVKRRVYQFSPDIDRPLTDPFGALLSQVCATQWKARIEDCFGGAPHFLAFMTKELIPALTAKYRIDTSNLGLFGVSAGGFFAAWTLFQEDSPFTRYIIASPAMAYGDGEVLRLEARWAETHDDLAASVFMAAGNLELNLAFEQGVGKIVSGMAELSGSLARRNYPGLSIRTDMFPGLGHIGAAVPTLTIGLKELYGK